MNTGSTEDSRRVVWAGAGIPTSDGAGVKLTRVIGQPKLPDLDPFLLLDEFGSDDPGAYIAGFPDHPHRGFETVTYMLAGRMRHRDNKGHEGLLEPGSVQWMTAGSGLVHSEMPLQDHGLMRGFQLWINLPAKDKMTAPRYQDIAPALIPRTTLAPGAEARVIAGKAGGIAGPVETGATDALYLDLTLEAGAKLSLPLPTEHNAFLYVYEGAVTVGAEGTRLAQSTIGVLSTGPGVSLTAGETAARILLIAGKPLREPVARYGPFVMNKPEEIQAAIDDMRAGRL
jgi:redox-sensitive bicupin YhaK (pirin superfamily)